MFSLLANYCVLSRTRDLVKATTFKRTRIHDEFTMFMNDGFELGQGTPSWIP